MNYFETSLINQDATLNNTENSHSILRVDPLKQKLIANDFTWSQYDGDYHELDRIDISRGRVTKRKFLNQVFTVRQQRKLFGAFFRPSLAGKEFSIKLLSYLVFWFFCILGTGYLILQAIQDEPALAQINSMVKSAMVEYKTDPIIEIQASDLSNSCPPSFDPLLLEKWPGTYAACFCPSENTLKQGECKSHLNLSGDCSDIQATSPSDLYSWGQISSLCVKRAQLKSDYVKSETCPKGYKTCSFGVCMTNSTPCPITSFLITDSSGSSESIQIGNSEFITPQRELNKPPFVSIAINQNFSDSLLLQNIFPKSAEQQSLDQELHTLLDSSDANQLLTVNHIIGGIYQIPLYQSNLKEQKVGFIARRKLAIKKKDECFGIEDDSNLNSNTLFGGIIALHCVFMAYYTLIIPLVYFNFKKPKVQQFFSNSCVQVLFMLGLLGMLVLWGVVCSPLGRAKNLIPNCFETHALTQILNDNDDMIFYKKMWLLLSCIFTILPLSYFKIVK